jgi:hypothetical protein
MANLLHPNRLRTDAVLRIVAHYAAIAIAYDAGRPYTEIRDRRLPADAVAPRTYFADRLPKAGA